jgi:hypothetical protein
MGRGGCEAIPAVAHRAALAARPGGVAAFALVVGLAVDNGGFDAVSWNRALLGLAVLVLLVALLARVERPGREAGALLAVLAGLAAWTALSYLWSESPASALEEAQRVALYAAAAAAVVLCARTAPVGAIAAGATVVACWNLATRVNGVGRVTGAGSEPIGYANALALVCVIGLALLPALPRIAWLAAAPLVAVLVLQHSSGADAALVVAVAVHVVRRPGVRLALVAAAVVLMLALPFVAGGHERQHYWRVALREAQARPVLGSGAGTYVNWWVRERDTPVQTREAHSLYVETLAELGPLGLGLVLALFAIPLAATRRPAVAAGIAAYAVAAAVDFDWELAGATVPVILLAALAVSEGRPRGRAPLRFVVPIAAVLAVAALLAYAGNTRLASAQAAARRGDFSAADAEARTALRWQPYSPAPWVVIGDVSHSADAYRHAVSLDRADWSLWQRLASVSNGRLRRLAEAKAAQLNPFR